MNSQLNPNAAVFIPVSPTRLLMMDEAIISASSGLNFEESPINLEYSRVPKHEDYFMRDNFSTIPNQSACSVADFTIRSSEEHMEHIPLDKLLAVQNNSRELEKANFFGITKVCIDKESDSTNISGKAVGFADKNVMEESALTGTTSSLKVEISCFTITEDVEPINNQTAVDVPVDDLVADKQASPDILSLKDEPLKESKQKKKTRANRYRFKRRPKKVEPHVDENSEGFVTEHRRSPPIDLTFKPIQTFGDANPFGALQTPTTTTPTDQTYNLAQLYKTPQETPMKEGESGKSETNQSDIIMTTPPSFIMRRSPVDECLVPFEELESPNELPPFMHPPNANRSITDIELPKSPNTQDSNENMPSLKLEQVESKIDSGIKTGFNELAQDLSVDVANTEKQEISSVSENSQVNKTFLYVDAANAKKQGISSVSENSKVNKTLSYVDAASAKKQGISSVSKNSKVNKTLSYVDAANAKKQGTSSVSENSKVDKTLTHVDAGIAKKQGISSVSEISKVDKTLSHVDDGIAKKQGISSVSENSQRNKTFANVDAANAKKHKTGYVSENSKVNKTLTYVDLDTNERFLRPEYTVSPKNKECEQAPKTDVDLKSDSNTIQPDDSNICDTPTLKAEECTPPPPPPPLPPFGYKTTDDHCSFDIFSSIHPEHTESEIVSDQKTNIEQVMQDLFAEDSNPEMQETSFNNDSTHMNKQFIDSDVGSNKELMEEISKIMQYDKEFEQTSKIVEDVIIDIDTPQPENKVVSSTDVLKAVNQTHTEHDSTDSKIKAETTQMKLALDTHVPTSPTTPEELRNLVQGFEVIDKDELIKENYSPKEPCEASLQITGEKEDFVNVNSPLNETNLLKMDESFIADQSTSITQNDSVEDDDISNNDFFNAMDKLNEAENAKLDASEHSTLAEIPQIIVSECTESSSLGKEDSSCVSEEIIPEETDPLQNPVLAEENKQFVEKEVTTTPVDVKSTVDVENVQNDPAQNVIVTEKLTPSSEEANNIPFVKVPQIAGTVTTNVPLPGLEDSQKLQELPETDISLTVTEAEADISDAIAEKEMEKEEEPVKVKKPVDETATRPSDIQTKKPAKPSATTLAARPAAAKTPTSGTKPATGAKTTTSATTTSKTPTVKPAASSITSTKMAASGTASAKTATSSTTTSKTNASGVTASKPAATVPSKPAAANMVASKPAASSAPSSKSTTSSVAPSKSSASSVASSKPASSAVPAKSSSSSVAPSKSSASGVASSKPASGVASSKPASSAVSAKSSSSSVAPSKSSGSNKTASTTVAPSKSVISSSTPLKSPVASSVSSKPASASKPAASSSTTVKPVSPSTTPTKPAASSTTATKPTATGTPTATSAVKPTSSKVTTPPSTKPSVTSTTPLKSVPTLLPGIEKTPTSLKFPSTPTTPTSNPTTPTTPKSPMEKQSTIKSPSRPETKSPLSAKTSVSFKPVKPSDKKPTTNRDVKLLGKKAEVPKSSTTATAKPSAPTKTGTSAAKPVGSATKSQTVSPNKTTASKPAAATTLKPKPEGASDEASNVSGSAGAKKSAAAPGTKIPDKTGKEPASGKLAANGKPASSKTSSNVKIDPKGNTKTPDKSVVGKKCEEEKKEEKSVKVQEHKVSTTNEFTNHTSEPMMHAVTEVVN